MWMRVIVIEMGRNRLKILLVSLYSTKCRRLDIKEYRVTTILLQQ